MYEIYYQGTMYLLLFLVMKDPMYKFLVLTRLCNNRYCKFSYLFYNFWPGKTGLKKHFMYNFYINILYVRNLLSRRHVPFGFYSTIGPRYNFHGLTSLCRIRSFTFWYFIWNFPSCKNTFYGLYQGCCDKYRMR